MRSRYKFVEPDGIYFVTATIVEWIPVFITREACEIVTDSLTYCRQEKGLRLYSYVIMENHLHLVAQAGDLGRVIQAFKRHTARELLRYAERTKRNWLLNQFEFYKKRYKEESKHQVWQEGVHPQHLTTDKMLWQKVDYIHDNPVHLRQEVSVNWSWCVRSFVAAVRVP